MLRCLVVDLTTSIVLVEVGLGLFDWLAPVRRLGRQSLRAVRPSRPPFGLRQRLEARGISADRIAHIVITHGHLDNLGGIDDFPNAKLHALRDTSMERLLLRDGGSMRQFTAPWPPTTRLEGFNLHRLDIPDIEMYLVELPGHAPTHAGVLLKVEGESILYVGDAVNSLEELTEPAAPRLIDWWSLVFEHQPFERLTTRERLRRLATKAQQPLRLIAARGSTSQLVFGPRPRVGIGFL